MKEKASDLGRTLVGWIVTVIAVLVLLWIAFKIIKGFVMTLVIIALIVGSLLALSWGRGLRSRRR